MVGRRKRRKLSSGPEKLSVNDSVEIRSLEDGLLGSWHPATITACERRRCLVQYDHLVCEDQSEQYLSEYVDVSDNGIDPDIEPSSDYRGRLRPRPPKVDLLMPLQYSTCVDAFYNDAWWEGVVFGPQEITGGWNIFFPDLGDELSFRTNKLRLTQDWDEATGEWSPRGKWLFLEVIEELQPNYVAPVSIKQIWYDLRDSQNYHQVVEWTCRSKVVWEELVIGVLNDYLRMTSAEFLRSINLSEDLVVYNKDCSALMDTEAGVLHSLSEQPNTLPLPPRRGSTEHVTKSTSSRRGSDNWVPLDAKINLEAEECPGCILEYLKSKRHGVGFTNKVRRHLLFLGWKIDCLRQERTKMTRYTSPSGKAYYSLFRVCEDLEEIVPEKASASKSAEFVESIYCPEAVIEYLQSSNMCNGNHARKKYPDLVENAKKHLSSIGWSFWSRWVQGRQVWSYESPVKKTYYSLRKACEDAIAIGSAGDIVPISSQLQSISKESGSSGDLLMTDSDVQRSMIPLVRRSEKCTRKKSRSSVKWRPPKRRRKDLVHDQLFSSQRRQLEINENEDGLSTDLPDKEKPTRVLRSSKRARKVPSCLPHNPLTVLSWLIDNNIVLPREKVYYRGEDNKKKAEGQITRAGIKCACCQTVFTLSAFEAHAKSTYQQPATNIFLEDGRSLLECQMQMLHNSMRSLPETTVDRKRVNDLEGDNNDHICSVCHYGGDLILCDGCPSSFHSHCLNLQGVPDGDWFCPSCCCGICNRGHSVDAAGRLDGESTLCCDQCERLFHVSCVGSGGVNVDGCPKGKWLCGSICAKKVSVCIPLGTLISISRAGGLISHGLLVSWDRGMVYEGLQNFQRMPIPLDHDDLTWTLIRPIQLENGDDHDEAYDEIVAESHSKLNLALEVMHECFEPAKEPRTGRDLVEDVIFGRGSELKRLNFKGFFTILLEKNDELISVATVRIYGGKVAEIPLVGTRFHYRRLGMCRFLMNVLEKKLMELGVEKLVLPAVPSVLNTWTKSFEFEEMPLSERSELLAYTFLDFQGTVMCQKLLTKPSPSQPVMPNDSCHQVCELADKLESGSQSTISELCQAEGGDSLDLEPLGVPKANNTSGCDDPPSDTMVPPPGDSESNSDFGGDEDEPGVGNNTCKFKGEIKQYTRKKPLTDYPNVEVKCR